MAITVDTFNSVTFLPFSDVAWTGLADPPKLPSDFSKAILAGTALVGFITNAGDPFTMVTPGGSALIPAAVVDSETTLTSVTVINSQSIRSDLARSLDGSLLYWRTVNTVTTYGTPDIIEINTITT